MKPMSIPCLQPSETRRDSNCGGMDILRFPSFLSFSSSTSDVLDDARLEMLYSLHTDAVWSELFSSKVAEEEFWSLFSASSLGF